VWKRGGRETFSQTTRPPGSNKALWHQHSKFVFTITHNQYSKL